jgi:hypothetical protein
LQIKILYVIKIVSFASRFGMKSLADFSQLELAYQYCIRYPNNRYHYQVLGDIIHSTLQRGLEAGMDRRFIQSNPIFRVAWQFFLDNLYSQHRSQHPNNIVYLSGRLTPD